MNFRFFLTSILFLGSMCIISTSVFCQGVNVGDASMQYNKTSNNSGGANSLSNTVAYVGVDLYTGRLQASLPIITLESSTLNIPISLSYISGSGVKPQDDNLPTGIGWKLMAGGCISRVVRGLPDEATNGYIGTNNKGLIAVSTFNNPSNGLAILFNNTDEQQVLGNPPIDGEPDLFSIETPFFNAQFTIDENGNVVFQNNTGLIVTHALYKNSVNSLNNSFKVIDAQGNQYYFGSSGSSRETITTKFFGQSFQFISNWYLDKIVAFNNRDQVTFGYYQGQNDTSYYYQLTKQFVSTFSNSGTFPPTTAPTSYSSIASRPAIYSTIIHNQPKYVSQIVTKSSEADLYYAVNSNSNINSSNPPILNNITVKQYDPISGLSNTLLKTFSFSYEDIETGISGYTAPFPYRDLWSDYYRRLLKTITVTGNTSSTSQPIKIFDIAYFEKLPYPDRGLPQNVDYWGYMNSTTFMADVTTADNTYFTNPETQRLSANTVYSSTLVIPSACVFMPYKFTNVTGEIDSISYEQNDFMSGSTHIFGAGARVNGITKLTNGGQQYLTRYYYTDVNGNSTGQIWSDMYKKTRCYFGTSCCNLNSISMSNSIYGISDNRGVVVGYSSVTTAYPNLSYDVTSFQNFSDYPDIITLPSDFATTMYNPTYLTYIGSAISSFAYKRGLPKSKAIFNPSNAKLRETIYTYGSLDAQPTKIGIGFQDMTWFLDNNNKVYSVNVYNSNADNYRLLQTIDNEFDQLTPGNYLQKTTNYTYSTNKRLVKNVALTDSKGQSYTKTYYYADESSIPMVTASEQTALSFLINPSINFLDVVVHEITSRNGNIQQTHNSYGLSQVGILNRVFLNNISSYNGSSIVSQKSYSYDFLSSNMISSAPLYGKPNSLMYGYNGLYQIAKMVNVNSTSNSVSQTIQNSNYFNLPGSIGFSSNTIGNIQISLSFGQYPGANNFTNSSYTLSGQSSSSGSLCYTMSGSGYSCGTTQSSVTLPNMPAGAYSLTGSVSTNVTSSNPLLYVYYPVQSVNTTYANEYFFQSFEEISGYTAGIAHTGKMYSSGNYTVPYVPPSGRSYLIQWWNLVGGNWIFNQQAYTANMILTGPVDDIRVFPTDGQITTYTYSPQVGKTSETDPAGKTLTYEYDGLQRLSLIRDQNRNIVKEYDYSYQTSVSGTTPITCLNYLGIAGFTAKYTNVATGVITTFTITSSSMSQVLGSLPLGNYNVSITKTGNSISYLFSICSANTVSGTSATFSNVQVTSNCNSITLDTMY